MNTDMTGRVETCRMNTDIQGQIETCRMKTSMIYVYIYIFIYSEYSFTRVLYAETHCIRAIRS